MQVIADRKNMYIVTENKKDFKKYNKCFNWEKFIKSEKLW